MLADVQGPRSAVRFTIPPDQTVTLDRLGTLQVLRANFENGKIMTDLGMKYGRTRYDIESAGREHDAKVHSPNSVLAVRGTKVSLYDQPPFAPEATSLTGRAYFRDIKKQVAFGGKNAGKTKVNTASDTPAGYALDQTFTDPRGQFAGRTETDNLFLLATSANGGVPIDPHNIVAPSNFQVGALPVSRTLTFTMFWTGDPLSDVDLSVISSIGEILSIANPTTVSGGQHQGNGRADDTGFGQESASWAISYPPGQFKVDATLKAGKNVSVTVAANDPDPLHPETGGQALPISGVTLTPQTPIASGVVDTPIPPTPAGAERVSAKRSSRPSAPPAAIRVKGR
jgi:hypothetical protein